MGECGIAGTIVGLMNPRGFYFAVLIEGLRHTDEE